MAYSPYKMKGHTLPGIKQVKSNKTKDGRAGSSAFQKKGCKSPYKKEGYNPDGSVDKNSERYKKAVANTKKSDARKARENELRNTMKTGDDVQARRAKTELMSKGKISMDEKRRRDAENKKKQGGKSSPAKLMGKDRSKTKTKESGKSKTVTIKDSKRSVVKRDAQGNVTKTKGGGVVTKPQKGKTTTRKAQVKKAARTAGSAAGVAAAFASPLYAPSIAKAGILGTAGVTAGSRLKEGLNSLERSRKKLKNRLKRKK